MFRKNILPLSLIVCGFATAANGAMSSKPKDCLPVGWMTITDSTIQSVQFSQVKESVIEHPYEKRGFVSVPLDYDNPDGRHLRIFYRLMPASSDDVDAQSLPILVVMNGGPGVPSSAYRSLDHDYTGENPNDAFAGLARYFRILAVDQRGTGNSSPLSLDDSSLSAAVIARFFDSDEHAKDHARIIETVIPKDEKFFILARSYGGHIGFKYLALGDSVTQPAGYVFSSSLLPHADALETFVGRREKQKQLNLALKASHPAVISKLEELRMHFRTLGIDPNSVNFLWEYLGRGEAWETTLERKIDGYLAMNERDEIESALGRGIQQSVNLLNYVLSSSALTPGYTDRSIAEEVRRRAPFDEWMLDETWTLVQIGEDGTWREDFICSVDRNPPPPTEFQSKEAIRTSLGSTHALFTFGASDAFLPQDYQVTKAKEFGVPERTKFHVFSGGHGAAFSSEGAKVVNEWAKDVVSQRPHKKFGGIPALNLNDPALQRQEIGAVPNSISFADLTALDGPANSCFAEMAERVDVFSSPKKAAPFLTAWDARPSPISRDQAIRFHLENDALPDATGALAIIKLIDGHVRVCAKIHVFEGAN